MLYHITPHETWEKAKKAGSYEGDTLASEGFIHCSTRDQLLKVANFQFRGQKGMILLEIQEDKVKPEVVYESIPGAPFPDAFPHIYGPLNIDAVTRTSPFEPNENGSFSFPA